MDRDNRRNSILKPASWNLASMNDCEEEHTENFTSSRRKSLKKRVSFAGRDEIKEFQKHEVLTVDKLKMGLIEHHGESHCSKTSSISELNCVFGKENTCHSSNSQAEVPNLVNFEMVTSTVTNNTDDEQSNPQNGVQNSIDMEITVCCPANVSVSSQIEEHHMKPFQVNCLPIDFISTKVVLEGQTCPAILVQESRQSAVHENSTLAYIPYDSLSRSTEEPHKKLLGLKTGNAENVFVSLQKVSTEESIVGSIESMSELEDIPENERSWLDQLVLPFNWNLKQNDNEILMSGLHDHLKLKIKLGYEFLDQNVKHFVLQDIKIDIKEDVEDKWTRFGLSFLENTLDQLNLLGICSSTKDLSKLVQVVEEHSRAFLEFLYEDTRRFELLANPRSIRIDAENSKLTFELSNIENVVWIRISLHLNSLFPFTARDVTIDSLLGKFNKAELLNMIATIRPSGLYLTRVAECIEDFLKFPPSSNKNVLNLTKIVDVCQ